MVGPEAELLEAPGLSRRATRAWALVAVLLLLVATAAYVVDQRVRRAEEGDLDDCVAQAQTAVSRAYRPVVARWGRVRPALDNGASLMVRTSIYRGLSEVASGRSSLVESARDRCARVAVLPFHRTQAEHRRSCVRLLDAHADFLERAATDARVLGGAWPGPVAGCRGRRTLEG
ncbi:MAG: hypothetical protein R2731_14410 [Nocardioides sp.]